MATYLGARHVVAFANGTAALHGAAFAAGLGPGDEAITSPISFAASANCVVYQAARPRFVDISPATWNLDTARAAAAVSRLHARRHRRELRGPAGRPHAPRRGPRPRGRDRGRGSRARRAPGGGHGGRCRRCRHDDVLASSGEGDHDGRRRARVDRGRRARAALTDVPHARHDEGGRDPLRDRRRLVPRDAGARLQLPHHRLPVCSGPQPAPSAGRLRRAAQPDRRAVSRAPRRRAADALFRPRRQMEISTPTTSSSSACEEAPAVRLAVFDALRRAGIGVQVHYIPIYRHPYYRDVAGIPAGRMSRSRGLLRGCHLAAHVPRHERRRRRACGRGAANERCHDSVAGSVRRSRSGIGASGRGCPPT